MRKALFLIPLIVLAGCSDKEYVGKYYQDSRTDLCFMATYNHTGVMRGLTNVPCTPEVKKLMEVR